MNLSTIDNTEDESDELFSDDEQKKIKSDALILNRFETSRMITSSDSAIPSTPLSLLPFLSKKNEQWTSDFETPQNQLYVKPLTGTTEKAEETPNQHTPDISTVKSIDRIISNSPIIAGESRASRRRSKRRIFKDRLAVTSNEDTIINLPMRTPSTSENINSAVKNRNVVKSISVIDNIPEACQSKVFNKIENTCNEELENLTNIASDSLDTSTQEFFKNASFGNIDQVCFNTFNNQTTVQSIVHCNQRLEDIDKERNIEENTNIGFFTARGASINVSKQAIFKAKRLFADAFDIDETQAQNEPFVKKNFNEQKNRLLSSSSVANTVSINTTKKIFKSEQQFTEQLKNYDKMHITDFEEPFVNKSSVKEINMVPILFSTASGTPINISKEALSKAKILLADEIEEKDNDKLIKYSGRSSTDQNCMKNMTLPLFSTAGGKPISVSEKSLVKAKMLLADESEKENDVLINYSETSSTDRNSTKPNNITLSLFSTAGGKPVSVSEKSLTKARMLLANESEKENDILIKYPETLSTDGNSMKPNNITLSLFSTAGGKPVSVSEKSLTKAKMLLVNESEKENDILIKYPETLSTDGNSMKSNNMTLPLFSTAGGKPINVSEKSLTKAKILFAEQLDTNIEQIKQCDINTSNIKSCITPEENIKRCDLKIPYNALIKSQTFFSSNYSNDNSSNLGCTSLQKHNSDSDENTPLGRNCAYKSKKARISNEFQARKLFSDNQSIDMDNDENRISDEKRQADLIINSALRSPERDAVETIELNVASSSPVLGTHSRKRKDLGHRRDKYNAPQANKITLDDGENIASRKNVAHEDAPCENINVNKDMEIQKLTQTEKQKAENNTEWSEYGDTQLMMYFVDESAKILQDRLTAALNQEKIITSKRRHGSEQSIGHLYRYKQVNSNARLSLKEISDGAPPVLLSHQELVDRQISPNILKITAATAASYTFRCSDFYGNEVARTNIRGIEMEDKVRLILDENGYVGIWEFLRAFLASPGVNPNLVPARWVENHYRWIVWKLASMDRNKFGSAELPRALTPSRVMAQLKYRYDREIDQFQRSAIRRILEKDDVASKRMILCVSSIIENNNVSTEEGKSPRIGVPKWRIELTDGWYNVPICIDIGLVKSISTGKVKEGTKLVVSGAELLNCDQGFHPLEAPATACLKLHTNSTRRARWYAKLGYASRSGPIPIKLRNVCPSGGLIGKMTIIVARVYPTLYHEKTASGDSIIRNAKCEEKVQSMYEQQCLSKIETFYANAERDFQEGLTRETDSISTHLDEDYKSSSTQESVSKKRRSEELLQELHQKKERFMQDVQSKLRTNLPGPRQVSQLLKVRVCDENVNAILSIWSPDEEVVNAFKEGACVSLYNVIASGKRGTELQLTARRSSVFKPVKIQDTRSYPARVCTSFCEMANFEFAPPYGEFDTVGFVCFVGPAPYGMKDFEVAHLAYPKTDSNDSYLSILFWQGIASYGYTEILTVGSIVACSNLEWRRATSWNVPAAYCTDRTTFTCNPRRNHLYESFENLQNLITDPVKYAERCTSALNVELQKKSTPTHYVAGKNTPIKIYNPTNMDKRLVDYTSPLTRLGTGSSPSFIASNPSIQRRFEKLQHYGEPPELSPLILRKSKRASLNFQSPVRISNADSTKDKSSINQSGDLSTSLSGAPEKQ